MPSGSRHIATGVGSDGPLSDPLVGKGRAVRCRVSRTSAVVHSGRADSSSAAAPATIGVAKLVPTLMSKLSVQIDPSATDGTQVAAGVLMQACDAALAERTDGLVVARHAIVSDHALQWPTGITTGEQQAAIAQLKSLGVLVRQGV